MGDKPNIKYFCVKVLDVKYQNAFNFLDFRYIRYEVKARYQEEAIQKARKLYMEGDEGESQECLPFLLKLFSVDGG